MRALLFRFRVIAFESAHVHLWVRGRSDGDAAKRVAIVLVVRIVLNQILSPKFIQDAIENSYQIFNLFRNERGSPSRSRQQLHGVLGSGADDIQSQGFAAWVN